MQSIQVVHMCMLQTNQYQFQPLQVQHTHMTMRALIIVAKEIESQVKIVILWVVGPPLMK